MSQGDEVKMGRLVHRAETGDGILVETGRGDVEVYAVKISSGEVKLSISAPKDMKIRQIKMSDKAVKAP